ncbi:MAG: hypothetical protein GF317_15880 [Candidatus Lokiarchaeota archaeon]|nr:hypothetical protein [Candidatus Lokiarchaeota archaeon]MBD3201027.1 hypothetical protein [Candidatus Lokiarchaeota archaeon]
MKKIVLKVPHRISGFFEIVDQVDGKEIEEPERIGSRGSGFNLTAMGITEISYENLKKDDLTNCEIYINSKKLDQKAETSFYIFDYVKNFIKEPKKIVINHKFELPVECGYGASGSGALGTIYGLKRLLKLSFTPLECGRIAHISEVINKTGLGTVCGQLGGGLSILTEPGYPCSVERIAIKGDYCVICTTFGKIHTKSILSDSVLKKEIKNQGRTSLKRLLINPSLEKFTEESIRFVNETKILEFLNLEKTKNLMNDLNKEDILGASMNQLGRSVYAICTEREKQTVEEIFESYQSIDKIYNLRIHEAKPHFL